MSRRRGGRRPGVRPGEGASVVWQVRLRLEERERWARLAELAGDASVADLVRRLVAEEARRLVLDGQDL